MSGLSVSLSTTGWPGIEALLIGEGRAQPGDPVVLLQRGAPLAVGLQPGQPHPPAGHIGTLGPTDPVGTIRPIPRGRLGLHPRARPGGRHFGHAVGRLRQGGFLSRFAEDLAESSPCSCLSSRPP